MNGRFFARVNDDDTILKGFASTFDLELAEFAFWPAYRDHRRR
ncbi:hypothetical protein FRUB_01141 [Fimbriiglobus ruber]|uniref:Uncharacterized protein n=1 Tax=Fimbriiglobus ruber TaxID=1908690 RepID=A0A225E1H8_9BACT|nr:hypothetical protein FRUB_01141 [Fimbriiglobus ruber]